METQYWSSPLQWCYNERNGVSNHRRFYCLLNRVSGEFNSQRASNPKNVSIWWRHHVAQSGNWFCEPCSSCFESTHIVSLKFLYVIWLSLLVLNSNACILFFTLCTLLWCWPCTLIKQQWSYQLTVKIMLVWKLLSCVCTVNMLFF